MPSSTLAPQPLIGPLRACFFALALALPAVVTAQTCGPDGTSPCPEKEDMTAIDRKAVDEPADGWTETELEVAALIEEPGITVVQFWAPWCGNSNAELKGGLARAVADHPDVRFVFVTVYNDGETDRALLDKNGLPEDITVLAQPDFGPSAERINRRRTFMDLPLTWTPSMWIFRDGTLAYLGNWGERTPADLARMIRDAQNEWPH